MATTRDSETRTTVSLNKNANHEKIIDQYKILTDSINTSNQLRESANNFWVTVNSLGISSIAYIQDSANLGSNQRPFIIWVLNFSRINFMLLVVKLFTNN